VFFSGLAGTTWYFQFFFYSMGHVRMGGSDPEGFGFSSWTLHMASIIIFSTMWGWIFHEWKGSSKKAHMLIALGHRHAHPLHRHHRLRHLPQGSSRTSWLKIQPSSSASTARPIHSHV
jgi:hypothetical protein